MPETLIFLHIPKTAGSSLNPHIARNFRKPHRLALPVDNLRTLINELKEDKDNTAEQFRYIHGHCPYGLHKILKNQIKYITLLRDPVDRTISSFHHILRHPQHPLHDAVKEMNLVEFAKETKWPQFFNTSTRLLGCEMEDFSLTYYRKFNETTTCEEYYWRARSRIATQVITGIQEYFNASLALFSQVFNLKQFEITTKRMVNPDRPKLEDIPDEDIQAIRESQRFDQGLYDFAKGHFMEMCLERGIDPTKTL